MLFRRRKNRSEIRREYIRLIFDLKQLQRRVYVYSDRLRMRIDDLLSKLPYETNENKKRSYASTILMYRRVLSKLKIINIVLEYLITKVETISLLEMTGAEVITIKEVLSSIKDKITEFPEIELIIEDLIERSVSLESFLNVNPEIRIKASKDAEKILEVAKEVAKEREREDDLLPT